MRRLRVELPGEQRLDVDAGGLGFSTGSLGLGGALRARLLSSARAESEDEKERRKTSGRSHGARTYAKPGNESTTSAHDHPYPIEQWLPNLNVCSDERPDLTGQDFDFS